MPRLRRKQRSDIIVDKYTVDHLRAASATIKKNARYQSINNKNILRHQDKSNRSRRSFSSLIGNQSTATNSNLRNESGSNGSDSLSKSTHPIETAAAATTTKSSFNTPIPTPQRHHQNVPVSERSQRPIHSLSVHTPLPLNKKRYPEKLTLTPPPVFPNRHSPPNSSINHHDVFSEPAGSSRKSIPDGSSHSAGPIRRNSKRNSNLSDLSPSNYHHIPSYQQHQYPTRHAHQRASESKESVYPNRRTSRLRSLPPLNSSNLHLPIQIEYSTPGPTRPYSQHPDTAISMFSPLMSSSFSHPSLYGSSPMREKEAKIIANKTKSSSSSTSKTNQSKRKRNYNHQSEIYSKPLKPQDRKYRPRYTLTTLDDAQQEQSSHVESGAYEDLLNYFDIHSGGEETDESGEQDDDQAFEDQNLNSPTTSPDVIDPTDSNSRPSNKTRNRSQDKQAEETNQHPDEIDHDDDGIYDDEEDEDVYLPEDVYGYSLPEKAQAAMDAQLNEAFDELGL